MRFFRKHWFTLLLAGVLFFAVYTLGCGIFEDPGGKRPPKDAILGAA